VLGSDTAPEAADLVSFTDATGNVFKITDKKITEVQYGSKTYTLNFGFTTIPTDKTITETNGNKYTFNDAGLLSSAYDSLNNDILSVTLAEDDLLEGVFADAAAEAEKRNYAGFTVATQEDAQNSLVAISDAIEAKDKIRARLGALQNRLENTISNLNIQAENLQAAESRISDVDVSTEMTEFVRQQILTQSAVAMLSQANSLPQMAMQLIGG
jgi:flagellin